ncbi:hypothetical protein [Bradyrhizobium sp. SEMIA]|uniref:hypothetical protein n=1 Tax=Bradyrhizobium sp. SEMIA TaxID=2597515 RepID=UPI0018A546B8|nr:hypothetical protein [Bradyrhizobium sp. SEMIA]QOG17916.1 hypothetical protein FOM02_11750 [Bradyrhizobium sp. SEMIA]
MNSPVIQALVDARVSEAGQRDAAIYQEVYDRLGEPPPVKANVPQVFIEWCLQRGVKFLPARPGSVALYLLENADDGLDLVRKLGKAISDAHVCRGLADPTTTWPVPLAMSKIAEIQPPRSWPKEEKRRFLELPYELQVYWAKHEDRRDKEIRNAFNEAAKARLAARQYEELEIGKTSDAAA